MSILKTSPTWHITSLINNTASGAFQNFWRTRENLCMNRVRSLLSMPCLLQGYISGSKLNSRDLGTAGSVKNFAGSSIHRYSVSATQRLDAFRVSYSSPHLRTKKEAVQTAWVFSLSEESTKNSNFFFCQMKNILPCERTVEEWTHSRISSTALKVKTTHKINSTVWMYCSKGFI